MAYVAPKDDKGEKLGDGTHRYSEGHIFELHADQLGQGLGLNAQTLSGNATFSGTITFSSAVVLGGGIAAGDLTLTGNLSVQQTAALDCVFTITAGQDKDAILRFAQDAGDDAGDKWQFLIDHTTNSLLVQSDIAVKDTFVTKATLMTGGALTITGDLACDGIVAVGNISLTQDSAVDAVFTLIAGTAKNTNIILHADEGTDLGDRWRISAEDGGELTFDSNPNVVLDYSSRVILGFEGVFQFRASQNNDCEFILEADAGADNADTWKLLISDGDAFAIQSFESGAFVSKMTIVGNTGVVTLAGFLVIPTQKGLTLTGTATGDLGTPADGTYMYDSTTNKGVIRENGAWKTITTS